MNTAGDNAGNATGDRWDDRRLQLLKDMGIDVWRQRLPAAEDSGRVEARPQSRERVARVESPAPAASRSVRQPPAADRAASPAATAAGPEVAPFSVLCVAGQGTVVLVEPSEMRTARRFCRDLLCSATGEWQAECAELVFAWPEQGVDRDESSMARALKAFVDGQAADHGASQLLIDAKVAERLGKTMDGAWQVIPPVDRLMTDGALKREVWSRMAGRRSG